ncbi:MAG: outer membrane protein assembly factor BamA [Candidatus Azosocius agrarius]|nr:MAG: outer membrane protein assembly factor BamA [Gammaproteobacteria bacterium]
MYRSSLSIFFLFFGLNCCFSYNDIVFNSFSSFVIEDISFIGLNKISSDIVLFHMPIVPGDVLSEKKASSILKNLYSLNCFKKIKMEINNKKIIIKFLEKSIISKILIKGSKKHKDILNTIKNSMIIVGSFYNIKNLYIAKEKIYKYYNEKLFHFGVEINVYISEYKSKINIIFDIKEGIKVFVKDVKIIGDDLVFKSLFFNNNLFSFFNSNLYSYEKLNVAIEKLKLLYLNSGYADIEIHFNKLLVNYNKKCINVVLKVLKGKKYFLRNVSLSGKFFIPKYKLLFYINKFVTLGSYFSINNIYKIPSILKEKFQCMGYFDTVIEYYCNFNKKNGYFDLMYYIIPGEKILTRYICFIGNSKTKDYVLKRCLYNDKNNYISNNNLRIVKDNLLKTNLIEDVNINVNEVFYNPKRTDIIYNINEAKTTVFTIDLGYNSSDNLVITASANISNFLGLGKNLNFNVEKSNLYNNYIFNYFDPFFIVSNKKLFNNIGMGYNIKVNNSILSKLKKVSEHSNNIFGCSVFWNISYYKNYQINLEFGYECTMLNMDLYTIKGKNIVPLSFLKNIYVIGNKFNEYYFNLGLKHNSLDKTIFPNSGIFYQINLKNTLPYSSINYYQISFIYNYYKFLLNRYVVNISGHIKYGGVYNLFYSYPFFKNYFLGGIHSVRGFEERSLGPKIDKGDKKLLLGGNFSFLFKISIFIPHLFDTLANVRTGFFFDMGQVYDTINSKHNIEHIIHSNSVKCSCGIVFMWGTPLGVPLEISFAKPLNVSSTDKLKFINCTLGTNF